MSSKGSNSLKRQSFSERICDDLSEIILQFLPLEDKLKTRMCVSKQFQRTIFVKQKEIPSFNDNIFCDLRTHLDFQNPNLLTND